MRTVAAVARANPAKAGHSMVVLAEEVEIRSTRELAWWKETTVASVCQDWCVEEPEVGDGSRDVGRNGR